MTQDPAAFYIVELIGKRSANIVEQGKTFLQAHLIRGGFVPHDTQAERDRLASAVLEMLPDSKEAERIAAGIRTGDFSK
jgi:hypothetical protein